MNQIHCPHCKAFLFKAELAKIEIKCRKCGRLVVISFYSQKALLLTPEPKANNIVAIKRSKEVIEPDHEKKRNTAL